MSAVAVDCGDVSESVAICISNDNYFNHNGDCEISKFILKRSKAIYSLVKKFNVRKYFFYVQVPPT